MRAAIAGAGFVGRTWNDVPAAALAWMRAMQDGLPPPVGIQVVLGPVTAAAFGNIRRTMAEDRIRVIQALFDRP